ncbi:MAG TPA: hypothetical protein VGC97_03775 [Pyrinomonadaceae bacterium]|jgi:hypothetical protein
MKRQDFLSRFFTIAVLLTALTSQAFAQQPNRPNPAGDGTQPAAAAGFVSGLFTLLPGQSVRVSAVNMGKKAIPVQIVFVPVGEQGKAGVSVLCDALPAPGDAAFDKYSIPDGTSNRQLMYVQIRVSDAKDLENIVPSLEVFNEQPGTPGGPHIFLSGADFAEIRPIWVPS